MLRIKELLIQMFMVLMIILSFKGPTQPRPCISSQEFLWSFEHHGLMIMIDWNIVCQRMKPIDYIIFFLGKKPSPKSLVMLFLVTQGILIGRM